MQHAGADTYPWLSHRTQREIMDDAIARDLRAWHASRATNPNLDGWRARVWRTRWGAPVRLLAIDAKGDAPLIGLIEECGCYELAASWFPDGRCRAIATVLQQSDKANTHDCGDYDLMEGSPFR